jgi:hypothetical protein
MKREIPKEMLDSVGEAWRFEEVKRLVPKGICEVVILLMEEKWAMYRFFEGFFKVMSYNEAQKEMADIIFNELSENGETAKMLDIARKEDFGRRTKIKMDDEKTSEAMPKYLGSYYKQIVKTIHSKMLEIYQKPATEIHIRRRRESMKKEKNLRMREAILDAEAEEFIEKVKKEIKKIENKKLQVDLIMKISVTLPGPYAQNEEEWIPIGGETFIYSEAPDVIVCQLEELAKVVEERCKAEEKKT